MIIDTPWMPNVLGGGDVAGPASATDNAVARFDGTTGKLIQNSTVTIADSTGAIAGASSLTSPAATNLTLGLGTGGTALTLTNSTLAAAFAGSVTATGTGAFGGSGTLGSTYLSRLSVFTAGGGNFSVGGQTNTNNTVVARMTAYNASNGNSGNESSTAFMGIASIESVVKTATGNAGTDSGGDLVFLTKGDGGTLTERMRLLSTGAATFAGAVTISTGAAVGGATAGAGGLAFPATAVAVANANTLDDYEEGTWTPSFAGSTTNPTVTYAAQSGSYTKIGRQVTVSFEIGTSAQTGGVGSVQIAGLPFTIGVRVYAAVATFNINNSVSGPMGIFSEANAGGSNFALLATGDNTSWTSVNYTDALSASIYLNGSFTYFV